MLYISRLVSDGIDICFLCFMLEHAIRARYLPMRSIIIPSRLVPLVWNNSYCTLKQSIHLKKMHDAAITWKRFPRYWPFVRGIHRSPVNSPHKGQWHGALMFYLICAWTNCCVNNRATGNLICHRAHSAVAVMEASRLVLVQGSQEFTGNI